ncbi:MAG: protein-glutamate O-methyltransferase CheR [Halobacteriota archaeon]|nr:protein-glutamate O-methyltransferase CheR [Halobacteriota archaeon]
MSEEDFAFEAVKKRIFEVRGLDTRQYKDSYIKRRLAVRMRANSVKSYSDYLRVLRSGEEEFNPLMNALTINVTEFFRNPETYKATDKVLHQIVSEKEDRGRRLLRIWSAGCSSGEEPYSIAILLNEILNNEIDSFTISIYATDLDPVILDRAKDGIYKSEHLKNVSQVMVDKYFTNKDGNYIVKDNLKRLIKFKKHDLISGNKFKSIDMILCRNVVIYFSRELQERLYMDFYNALNYGGYFIMGKTESLVGESLRKFKPINKSERVYRKIDNY